MKQHIQLRAMARGLALAGAALAAYACTDSEAPTTEDAVSAPVATPAPVSNASNATVTQISQLPLVEGSSSSPVLAELLPRPTALGETTALHVKLPPPRNSSLRDSLVRIVGDPSSPQVLFKSDALAQMRIIDRSPGSDFFTAFSTLSRDELSKVAANQDALLSGANGAVTSESIVFDGRGATARTVAPRLDPSQFVPGVLVPINRCAIRPVSTQAAWDKTLFIRDPAVVQDPLRTWDPCTGAGTQGGVWTFAHLMRQMAIGSGFSAEDFVKNWLSLWLNNYTVNADVVPARVQMFNQVIQPWATASGVVATLVTNPVTGFRSVTLTGPLNLNIAPFRLLAIVNRIDLGRTTRGGGGYGGGTSSRPVDAGELRFIFNVVQPNPWGAGTEGTCGRKLFTTIFEYGVPITGCANVVNWARRWTQLGTFPGFTAAYRTQLASMTQSVVLNGAAPTKGNQNAINQIRTNEIALAGPWELREFTLTAENPPANLDPPANGLLRPHTVAQTPNDGAFSAAGANPTINNFVNGVVTPAVPLPVGLPAPCSSNHQVPYFFAGLPFRGGNALIGPGHWRANSVTLASPARNICARFQFSFNTCGGCHQNDSGTDGPPSTNFTHIDVFTSPPVTMSRFLTGGGPGLVFNVPDTQLGAPIWPFADLERRFQRLFDISHCTNCTSIFAVRADFVNHVQTLGNVPIDPGPEVSFQFRVGPVTDLATVQKIIDARGQFAAGTRQEPADFVRPTEEPSH